MRSISTDWVAESRTLAGISLSVSSTMVAQFTLSTVETLAVARLGLDTLAGVTFALSLYFLVFLFALGIVTAVTPIVSQARGRADRDGIRLSGQQGFWVGLSFSVPGAVLLLALGGLIGLVSGGGARAANAAEYLFGAAWGLPAWVCYVTARSLAVATGAVRVTTIIMVSAIPLHAGLTWWLVFGGLGLPPLGALGAGIAYSLTGFAALALLPIGLRIAPAEDFGSVFRRPLVLDRARFAEIVRLGIPFACRILLREGVLPTAAFALAPFGAAAVAAHAVAVRIVELTSVFSFGFSNAATMRVGYALGWGSPRNAARSGWIAIQLASVVSVLVAIAVTAEPDRLARWILGEGNPAEIRAAVALLPVAACLQCFEGIQSAAGGALSGMRDAKGPLVIAILGSWLVGMPLGVLLSRLTDAPVQGLWAGLAIGAAVTTVLLLRRFRARAG